MATENNLVVYSVRERDGARDIFTRIGAAFPHKDGKPGFTLLLDALPVGRKVVVLPPKEDDKSGE